MHDSQVTPSRVWAKIRSRTGKHALVSIALACATMLLAFAGCGLVPVAPPTAQQIFDNALHSKMKDATIAISGSLDTAFAGTQSTIAVTGSGHVVLKPAQASQLTLTMNLASSTVTGVITLDSITTGDTAYVRTQIQIPGLPIPSSNLYTKTTVPASQGASFIPQSATNLKLAGEEVVRGDKCWHLTGSTSFNALATPSASGTTNSGAVTFDLWVRESDSYLVRIKLDTLPGLNLPLGGASTGTSGSTSIPGTAGVVIDLSNYDQGTKITAPPADQVQN